MLRNLLHPSRAHELASRAFQLFNNPGKSIAVCRSEVILENTRRHCSKLPADETTKNSTQAAKKGQNPFAQTSPVETSTVESQHTNDEERTKRLKVLQLEVDIAYQEGRRVPHVDFLKEQNWDHVLTLPSKSARFKYYGYLWQIEAKKESKERKKAERAEHVLQHKEDLRKQREENDHIIYGLGHTSLFLRIYDSTINQWQNNRLTRAMQFSPKIVLDCSYDKHMTSREAQNAAKQLMLCFAENRAHDDPFDLHYCNVNLDSTCIRGLQRYVPTMMNPEFPMNVHEKCFTELFPKENLVYLTPHCRTDLEVYDPDAVYIIGAMVDTVNNEPLSLAKAKRLGIRMARFPLDRYLQWGSGSGKSLTLNQVLNIMLDLKSTKDWQKALRHVPRRKVVDLDAEKQYQKRNSERRANKLKEQYDEILNSKHETRGVENNTKVRSYMEKAQFNLETWASKDKNRKVN